MLAASLGLAGCGGLGHAVSDVKKAEHDVSANKATIDQFTAGMKTGKATAFRATYTTTGDAPATVTYAVRPPHELAFREAPASGGRASVDLIINARGEFACSPPASSGARWTCRKLGPARAAVQNQVLGFYTPAHWVTFLRDFSLAAGFAGDKVGSGHLTVNGFRMRCVTFRAAGIHGTSRICTTAQGILGYVKVASQPTSFEITSYTTAPRGALFQLPIGARVTTGRAGG
ncbi:MAG TPA: hypothetical protein VGG35_08670 [Streptosporangiaceae bacterium]